MALNININLVAPIATIPANTKVADIVVTGGTAPYNYTLTTGSESFSIDGTTVKTKAEMTIANIASFSVLATDSASPADTVTSDVTYPAIESALALKMTKANIIYKITRYYDLGHGTLTIPAGCTLDFQGGSLNNGTIIFNDTELKGEVRIKTSMQGSLSNNEVNVLWFNVKGNGTTDARQSIQDVFNIVKENSTIVFPKTTSYYRVVIGVGTGSTPIEQRANALARGSIYPIVSDKNGLTIIFRGTVKSTNIIGDVFQLSGNNVVIKGEGGKIQGPGGADTIGFLDNNTSDITQQWYPTLIKVSGAYNIIQDMIFEDGPTCCINSFGESLTVVNCSFIGGRVAHSENGTVLFGVRLYTSPNSIITKCRFEKNSIGGKQYSGIFVNSANVIISDNIFSNYSEHGVYSYGDYNLIIGNLFTETESLASDIQYFAVYGTISNNMSKATTGFLQVMHGRGTIIDSNNIAGSFGGIL